MGRRRDGIAKVPATSAFVADVAGRHRAGDLVLLDALHAIQGRRGHLSRRDLEALSYHARVPLATLHGTASFYPNFRMTGPAPRIAVKVCTSLPCRLRGAERLLAGLTERFAPMAGVEVRGCQCLGICEKAPAVSVNGSPRGPASVEGILQGMGQGRLPRTARPRASRYESLARYRRAGGYDVLERLRRGEWDATAIVSVLKASGLRGMGGAGFPTGMKWEFVLRESATPKYVVCNADESEVGTFKDRTFLEETPHALLEGLLLAATAIGAREAVLYVREEYLTARANLAKAIRELRSAGLLDSGPPTRVVVGAGAYICGEETAMFESIEGKRPEPRLRPPYPAQVGLWGKPTLIQNVETLVRVPQILRKGPEWYRSAGRNGASGIKRFAVCGQVRRPGTYDVPLGIPAAELLSDHGGGMEDGGSAKAVFPGGLASGFLAADQMSTPMDFDPLARAGVMLGSGGVIAVGAPVCAVDLAENALDFFAHESCGKCTPCRAGTEQLLRMVRALRSRGTPLDPGVVDDLASVMVDTSICGLGTTAPIALRQALQRFPEEFEAHAQGRCLTGWCVR